MASRSKNSITIKTPASEVIRKIMEDNHEPISIEDLSEKMKDVWGRDFAENPYDEYCLIYKIAVLVLNCEASFEGVEGGIPYIPRTNPNEEPIALNPRMRFEVLNEYAEQIKKVKVTLKYPENFI